MRKSLFLYPALLLSLYGTLQSCNNSSSEDSASPEAQKESGFEKGIRQFFMDDTELRLETTKEEINKQVEEKAEDSDVKKFYRNREYSPAWTGAEVRTGFLEELQKADSEGLFLKDYYTEELKGLLEKMEELDEAETAVLDILLTEAYLSYAHDLYYGKLDPKKMYEHWGISRKNKDLGKLLQESLDNGDPAAALNDLKPSHKIYGDLKKSLQEYSELRKKQGTATKIETGKAIKTGEKDGRIPAIAARLKELGFLSEEITDSLYTAELQQAVKKFQKEKGLQVDGIIGNSSIEELNMDPEERYRQILANLERWRWYPRDLGSHYILINIPQFKLAVVKEGDTVRTHNIIAGTRERQTAIFTDTIQYVVINPTWTIPPTIKTKDVIPKARRNPSYLTSHNMKVYKGGKPVDPSQIDWNSPDARSYTIVQRAGPSNPLGQVKIIYPNPYLIYLHDTPAQSLFSQNQRAESSGCVRVENAVDLSGYVLSDQENWNAEKIREAINSGKTQEVKINQPIQVHHFYWTAWRAGGETVFTEDVYRLDKEVYTRLLESD